MKMSLCCSIPDSSRRQHSVQTCCKLHASFVCPSHPLPFIPSLCLSVPQRAVHALADDQRCLVGDQHYKHALWIIKDDIKTGQSLLSIVFPLFSIHLSVLPTFLLSLCSCGCFEKKMWHVQTRVRGEEQKHCSFSLITASNSDWLPD